MNLVSKCNIFEAFISTISILPLVYPWIIPGSSWVPWWNHLMDQGLLSLVRFVPPIPGFPPFHLAASALMGWRDATFHRVFPPPPPRPLPPSTFHHITPTVNISSALIGPCLQGCHLLRFLTRASGAPNRWRWLSSLDSEVQRALLGSSMMNPC